MDDQFKKYAFTLDDFQKKAITAIEMNKHVLVCAPTGSGKSLVAQHTVDWGLRQKKRVIYTTPIKSLSNQAYASLAKDFGADNVGIMTGDNQYNPGAAVLIMTTEILRNFLLDGRTRRHDVDESDSERYWTMDVAETVAAVVFDEVHYLQDPHRGHVWETCFVRMPQHVSMTMLSATIENPRTLISWLASIHTKPIELCEHTVRAVPLAHCLFTNLNPSHKQLPDPDLVRYKNALVDVSKWGEPELTRYMKPIGEHHEWFQKSATAIEGCVHYLKENDMMPTLCFVLSRKRCESLCQTWTVGLLDRDQVALIHRDWKRTVRDACRGDEVMLRKIEGLPQYRLLTESLMKGVAFHHSGVVPILKECVEVLMKDGRVPCVFATETFAVGINSPTRTVIMSQIDKRTEGGVRCLESHEYTQMGGRAGRRGLDTVGFVVSLPISFVRKTSALQWYRMVHGDPVHISSTQIIPTEHVLRALNSGEKSQGDLMKVVGERSMRAYEIAMASSPAAPTASPMDRLTDDEKRLWESYEKLTKMPTNTQGKMKKKQKKIKEFMGGVDITVWNKIGGVMEEMKVMKEEEDFKRDEEMELETTLNARLCFLKEMNYVSLTLDRNWKLEKLGQLACVISQSTPTYMAYILKQMEPLLNTMRERYGDDEIDAVYLLQWMSLFRGSCIEDEDVSVESREILGDRMVQQVGEHTKTWDMIAQRHHCWEPNTLYCDMVGPLEELRKYPEAEWDFFLLQKITGWQEGSLWKTMNDLVAFAGEWLEVFGLLGNVHLYKKCKDTQSLARQLTIMIPSLYLQQNSLSLVDQVQLVSSEMDQDSL